MQQEHQSFTYRDVLAGVAHLCKGCIHGVDDDCAISGQMHKVRFVNNLVMCNERNLHPTEISVIWRYGE